ncbi:MAG: HlyD family type I secretion periplasmic adaptor subunit [Hyphomicrobiaceae bacterium]
MTSFAKNKKEQPPKVAMKVRSSWQETKPWTRFGHRVVIWLTGGVFLFAALVSIAGAVVATGTITVKGRYQAVQHRDGGIVKRILVANGDRVQAGDVLIELDGTRTKATRDVVAARVVDLTIQEARLIAERDRKQNFEIPNALDDSLTEAQKFYAAQLALFNARIAARDGQISVLKERLGQLKRETSGLHSQLTARRTESRINADELAVLMPMFKKGYVNQQRIAPLKRETARLKGEIGRLTSEIAKTEGIMSETKLRIAQANKEFTQHVVDELHKVQTALGEQRETYKAQADSLHRIQIRAPRDGIVHALEANTVGGVITPASTIAQIIPENDKLQVEARIAPRDVDKVRTGLPATINLTAFNGRITPRLQGHVTTVSAAELLTEDGTAYFTAQIEIAAGEMSKVNKEHRLLPGMPAEVFIKTSSRSILSYFLRPLTDAMSRALREG